MQRQDIARRHISAVIRISSPLPQGIICRAISSRIPEITEPAYLHIEFLRNSARHLTIPVQKGQARIAVPFCIDIIRQMAISPNACDRILPHVIKRCPRVRDLLPIKIPSYQVKFPDTLSAQLPGTFIHDRIKEAALSTSYLVNVIIYFLSPQRGWESTSTHLAQGFPGRTVRTVQLILTLRQH